jgi:hypothetical protein
MLIRLPNAQDSASRYNARSESSFPYTFIIVCLRIPYPMQKIGRQSKNPASRLFDLLASHTATGRATSTRVAFPPLDVVFATDGRVDGQLEDVVDALHLLAAALDVHGAHPFRDGLALFRRNGSETLSLEEVDAGPFRAEVGFEPDEDQRGRGAEVEDFGVPLQESGSVWHVRRRARRRRTLSMTFSREFGQSMAKHTNRRSVSG